MRRREHQQGFSTVEILLVVLVDAVLTVTGLVVYQRHKPSSTKSSAATSQTQNNTQPQTTTNPQPAQPVYANWPVYSNTKYSFSYNYPTTWAASDEVTIDPQKSAFKEEFSTGLKLINASTPYNQTVVFEILNEPLQTAETSYDQYYAQSTIKVNKTTADLKGKSSVQYDFKAPTYESKRYLFA